MTKQSRSKIKSDIDSINDALGDEKKVKQKKSIRLLSEISKEISGNSEVTDKRLNEISGILDKIAKENKVVFQGKITVDVIEQEVIIAKPKWYQKFDVNGFISKLTKELGVFVNKITKNRYKANIDKYQKEKEAIAVKLVDKDGKFIDELIPPIHVGGGGGGGPDIVALKDASGNPISSTNPLHVQAELEVSDIEIGAVEIKDHDSETRVDVNTLHLETFKDERDNAMCVSAGAYGFDDSEAVGQKMRPMIMDIDDDDISTGQQPQLVIPLNYYYEAKSQGWRRWEGSDGSSWVHVTNFPATDFLDDSLFTVASDRGVAVGGVFTTDTVDANDFGVFRITENRNLITELNQGNTTLGIELDIVKNAAYVQSETLAAKDEQNRGRDLLKQILLELKKINLHQEILSEREVDDTDVDIK